MSNISRALLAWLVVLSGLLSTGGCQSYENWRVGRMSESERMQYKFERSAAKANKQLNSQKHDLGKPQSTMSGSK